MQRFTFGTRTQCPDTNSRCALVFAFTFGTPFFTVFVRHLYRRSSLLAIRAIVESYRSCQRSKLPHCSLSLTSTLKSFDWQMRQQYRLFFLQCSDTVDWATRRTSGLHDCTLRSTLQKSSTNLIVNSSPRSSIHPPPPPPPYHHHHHHHRLRLWTQANASMSASLASCFITHTYYLHSESASSSSVGGLVIIHKIIFFSSIYLVCA